MSHTNWLLLLAGIMSGRVKFKEVKHLDCSPVEPKEVRNLLAVAISELQLGRRPLRSRVIEVARRLAVEDGEDPTGIEAALDQVMSMNSDCEVVSICNGRTPP